jgi:hypothetical protein
LRATPRSEAISAFWGDCFVAHAPRNDVFLPNLMALAGIPVKGFRIGFDSVDPHHAIGGDFVVDMKPFALEQLDRHKIRGFEDREFFKVRLGLCGRHMWDDQQWGCDNDTRGGVSSDAHRLLLQ